MLKLLTPTQLKNCESCEKESSIYLFTPSGRKDKNENENRKPTHTGVFNFILRDSLYIFQGGNLIAYFSKVDSSY